MKNYIKKIIAGVLVLSTVILGTGALTTQPAYAILGAGDVVTDPGNTFQGLVNATENGITSSVTAALGIKTFTLDAIAVAIAKQILQQLTLSVVNWINSGFSGSPAFVQNPAKYFENIGDEIAGSFLQANGDLRFLCSPFSLDIRIALAVKMQGQIAQKYTCTLSNAIKNATNAAKGASITGFVQGDFSQGGFPALLTLTTDPQNNAGGAFLQAEDDLTKKINSQVNQKTNELSQGHGFMSWQDCKYSFDESGDGGDGAVSSISEKDYNAATNGGTQPVEGVSKTCTTQTPGDVISATLNEHLAVPTRELELANDINAIINALFTQLVSQVLQLGLGAISGSSGSSAGTSYLNSLAASSQQQNQTVLNNAGQSISSYLQPAAQVKDIKDQAVAQVASMKNDFTQALTCWTPYATEDPAVQTTIANLQNTVTTKVAPLQAQTLTEDTTAAATLKSLTDLQNSVGGSQTLAGAADPAQQLQNMATSNSVPTATDVIHAQTALDDLNKTIDPIDKIALQSLQQCKNYVPPYGTQ